MKKNLCLLMVALISMIGINANALNITVKANPEHISKIALGSNTEPADAQFSAEGVLNTDLNLNGGNYIKITPANADVKYQAKIYKADGTEKLLMTAEKTGASSLPCFNPGLDAYEGGTLVIESRDTPDYITVNIDGDPAKVKIDMSGNVYSGPLNVGENLIPLQGKIVMIEAVGGAMFYKLFYNGEEKNATTDAVGSKIKYFYAFTSAKNGDRIDIVTDFPDETFKVKINCAEYPKFITKVTVDGTRITSWQEFDVNYGQEVIIQGNYNNYQVHRVLINGVAPDGFSGTVGRFIKEDTEFTFDVTPLNRDKKINVTVTSPLKLSYVTALGASFEMTSAGGTHEISYADVELPLVLYAESTSSNDSGNRVRVAYINDQLVAHSFYNLKLDASMIKSGDNVKIDYQNPYFTVNADDAGKVVMNLFGTVTPVTSGAQVSIKDTENNYVVFSAVEGYRISSLLRNGTAISPKDGVYRFIPEMFDVIDITVAEGEGGSEVDPEPEPCTITINVDNVDVLMYGGVLYGDNTLINLNQGANTIDLTQYGEEEGARLVIPQNAESSYVIDQIIYNGVNVVDDSRYNYGTSFVFVPANGDVFTITSREIVRDQRLVVYVSGAENLANPFIADETGFVKLAQLEEGYQDVYFAANEKKVLLHWEVAFTQTYVYLNDQKISRGFIEVSPNDVIKVYAQAAAPEFIDVKFNILSEEQAPVVIADGVRTLTLADNAASVLPGTHISFAAPNGVAYSKVVVNGQELKADAEGNYVLDVTAPISTIEIGNKKPAIPGDFDGDGTIKVGDLQILINAILSSSKDAIYDMDGDGEVLASDIVKMIDIVMGR